MRKYTSARRNSSSKYTPQSAPVASSSPPTTVAIIERPSPQDKYERFEQWLRDNGAKFEMVRFVETCVCVFVFHTKCFHCLITVLCCLDGFMACIGYY